MHIRSVTPEDHAAIAAFDMQPLPAVPDPMLRVFTTWFAPVCVVAEEPAAGTLAGVGLTLLSLDRATAYLHRLVVVPARRGGGLGGALLEATERAAAAHGAARLALYTSRAADFYTPRGYRELTAAELGDGAAYNGTTLPGRYYAKELHGLTVAAATKDTPPW